ncbi:MAG: glycosyltransferase, partial [Thermoplasmata archaeon]
MGGYDPWLGAVLFVGWTPVSAQSTCLLIASNSHAMSGQGGVVGPSGRVLITVPVKDERQRLIPTLYALKEAFDAARFNYVLSVAEDGSTDGSKLLLPSLPELFPGIVIQDRAECMGRGKALRILWSAHEADVYAFCDADLASGAQSVVDAVRLAQG